MKNIQIKITGLKEKNVDKKIYNISHEEQLNYLKELYKNEKIERNERRINEILLEDFSPDLSTNFCNEYPPIFVKPIFSNIPLSSSIHKIILKEIKKKISSYIQQDKKKFYYKLFKPITINEILFLLYYNNLKCHYCKEKILILFIKKRDPYQWSLDRIDNNIGHTYKNCLISCLKCNLQRRCQGYNKFNNSKNFTINITNN